MKNWLGMMFVVAMTACQVVETGTTTEDPVESTTEQGAFVNLYCNTTLPAVTKWTGLPFANGDTVVFVELNALQGNWRIWGVDPVQGAVLWGRYADTTTQGASVMAGLAKAGSFTDYTRPPPCGVCPVGDGWVAKNMLDFARLKRGIPAQANALTSSCYQ